MAPVKRELCTATRRDGEPCGRRRVPGATVCPSHGGEAPQVRATAVEAEARLAFGRLAQHAEPVDDPFTALAQVAGEVLAWKEFCASRISSLTELDSLDAKGTEQTVALVQLFERAMDRSVGTLSAIAKLGIEDRLAKVNERQAAAVVRAIDAALDAAEVGDADQRARARAAGARALRAAS